MIWYALYELPFVSFFDISPWYEGNCIKCPISHDGIDLLLCKLTSVLHFGKKKLITYRPDCLVCASQITSLEVTSNAPQQSQNLDFKWLRAPMDINGLVQAGVSIFFGGWGGRGSQIGDVPTAEALVARKFGFWETFLRCREIHPEQFMPNLSAWKRHKRLFV